MPRWRSAKGRPRHRRRSERETVRPKEAEPLELLHVQGEYAAYRVRPVQPIGSTGNLQSGCPAPTVAEPVGEVPGAPTLATAWTRGRPVPACLGESHVLGRPGRNSSRPSPGTPAPGDRMPVELDQARPNPAATGRSPRGARPGTRQRSATSQSITMLNGRIGVDRTTVTTAEK